MSFGFPRISYTISTTFTLFLSLSPLRPINLIELFGVLPIVPSNPKTRFETELNLVKLRGYSRSP